MTIKELQAKLDRLQHIWEEQLEMNGRSDVTSDVSETAHQLWVAQQASPHWKECPTPNCGSMIMLDKEICGWCVVDIHRKREEELDR